MAALTTQSVSRAGVNPTFAAVSASDTFTPGADVWIEVNNGGGSPDSVTVGVSSGYVPAGNLTVSMAAVSVTNGQNRKIGPFPSQFFADPTTGLTTVTHSFTTSVTAGVFQLSRA